MYARFGAKETDMQVMRVRLLWGLLLFGVAAASGLCAQEPSGAVGDVNPENVQQAKKAKPEKVKQVRSAKPQKPEPLYTFPKSEPWWRGGGPGPAGAGAK
jgi:hypothetical protein